MMMIIMKMMMMMMVMMMMSQVTTEAEGEVYCCASGCDWGEVWVWAEDGVTQCACSHQIFNYKQESQK